MRKDPIQKSQFINELEEGQQLRDLFLVSRKNLAETKNGKPYLALSLMDRTGEIEARVWDNAEHFDTLAQPGDIVAVEALVKAYRDQLQLNIFSLAPAGDPETQLHHFMPASKRSAGEMVQELEAVIDSVSDQDLQLLLKTLFHGDTLQLFSKAPAAKQMHHAYIGGLLEHTLSVTGLAMKLAEHYPALDRDLLISGALLHDLGKIREFSFNTVPFDYTDPGRLVGHLVLGSEMVRQAAGTLADFPVQKLDQLVHLILSHHGRHEFGAPCLPMTAEAILLHHLDDIDAKMNYIDRLSEQVEPGTFQWSDYQRPLERFLLLKGHNEESSAQPPEPPQIQQAPEQNKPLQATPEKENKPEEGEGPANRQGKLF